jgi:peroxiredoxin
MLPMPLFSRPWVIAAALAGAVAAASVGYKTLNRRDAAPAVRYTLLDGRQAELAQSHGKVMLVNFWATSCTTCVHEMPNIIATHQQFKDRGFDTLAVAMSYDPPAYVANFAESRKLPFPVAIDNTGALAKSFGNVQLTPTTFVINKRGEIVKRYVGEPDFAALHRLLEQLLAEAA